MKKIWFKRKCYGWGWYPATWQGWAITLGYVAILLALGLTLDKNSTDKEAFLMLALPLFILTSILIRLCYKYGEKPRWSWGKPKKDK
ncbi:MAG: hypothetical protein R3B52_01050 [Candidatus Paceibacterota bacterium]